MPGGLPRGGGGMGGFGIDRYINGVFSIYSNMAPRLRGIKQKKLIIPSNLGAKLEF